MYDAHFPRFFKGFRVEVNEGKSSVYISRVSRNTKLEVLEFLGVQEGDFPFRYLGVSFYSKKLNIHDCWPLLEKILGKIKFWSLRLLSF